MNAAEIYARRRGIATQPAAAEREAPTPAEASPHTKAILDPAGVYARRRQACPAQASEAER